MISVECSGCTKRLRIPPNLAGRTVKCPSCAAAVVVPKSPPSAPTAAVKKGPPPPRRAPVRVEEEEAEYAEMAEEAEEDEGEEADEKPKRKKKKSKQPKSKMAPVKAFLARFPGPVQVVLVVSVVAVFLGLIHPYLYFAPLICGLLIIAGSTLTFLLVAFNESPMHALATIFFPPFYGMYYLATRWEETRLLFFLSLYGYAIIFSILLVMPLHVMVYDGGARSPQVAQQPPPLRPEPARPWKKAEENMPDPKAPEPKAVEKKPREDRPKDPPAKAPAMPTVEVPKETLPIRLLSDMEEFDVKAGAWPVTKNGKTGASGKDPIWVDGRNSPNGLGMHPPINGFASMKYRLDGKSKTFKAGVALNDTSTFVTGAATFEVLGDGRSLWKSEPLSKAKQVQECAVDVAGVKVLELRVGAERQNHGLNALWIEPRILLAK